MRKPFGLSLFVVTALCSAQSPATAHYHSDAMNFDLTYPASFHPPKGTTDEELKNMGKDVDCVSVPIGVMDMSTSFNMIFVKHFDLGCLGVPNDSTRLSTTASNFLTHTLGQFGSPAINPSIAYDISGHNAALVTGFSKAVKASGNNVIHGAAGCVASGKDMACFLFLSNECSNLAGLAANKIQFKDAAATPVIPANLDLACKQ